MINWPNLSISVTNPTDIDIFNIVDRLPNLSILSGLFNKSPISLDFDESYTLFAPTNFAIESFGEKIKEIKESKKVLKSFLEGHIVKGKFLFNHLRRLWDPPIKVKSLSGKLITLDTNVDMQLKPEFSVMDGKAVKHDIELMSIPLTDTKGGLIYLLDSVIELKGTLRKMHLLKYF